MNKHDKCDKFKLATKTSDLIELVLDDLEACERAKETYKINMDVWHKPSAEEPTCRVCLAGSVMAQTFNVPPTEHATPGDFSDLDKLKFGILNAARSGNFLMLSPRGDTYTPIPGERYAPIPGYYSNPEKFKSSMRAKVKELRQKGY